MGSHNLTSIIMGAVLGTLGLGSMASCGYSALCCVGTTVCSRICCASCPNIKNSTVTRIVYAILMFLLTIAAWIMMDDNISSKLLKLNKYTGSDKTDPADICNLYQVPVANCTSGAGGTVNKLWGEQGVSRVMFSGTCFFFLMGCMMVGASSSSGGRGTLQNGLWGIKILMIAAIAVGAFFIPNVFFAKTWAYIGLVGGFLWTLAQLVLIIDFAYSWADSWVGKIEEGSNCYKWLTILCSLGMYIGSLTMIIIMFVFYGKPRDPTTDASCGQNKALIAVNLVLAVGITVIALSGRVQEAIPNSGLLQAGVVVSYVTYYTWSAVSENDQACTPSSMKISEHTATVVGALFTFAAVAYASLRTSPASSVGKLGMNNKDENGESRPLKSEDDDDMLESGKGGDDDDDEREDDESGATLYNWCYFHMTFALATLYLMEVMTDWGAIRDGTTADVHIGRGKASVWLKIASAWLSAALYIWTLVAPLCFPDRDFD